jgi:hypothetical protein
MLCYLGLKRKHLFSFSRKAKISENSLTFRKISFRENFRFRKSFREKLLFPGWFFAKIIGNIHQCSDLDTHSSDSWILIRIPKGKFSRKFSQLFVSFFREKRHKFFAKFSRKYENEYFRFNSNVTIYITLFCTRRGQF